MSRKISLCAGSPAVLFSLYPEAIPLEPLAESLMARKQRLVWLDSARGYGPNGRYSILGWDPWLTISTTGTTTRWTTSASSTEWPGDPLETVRRVIERYSRSGSEAIPSAGLGLLGVLGYELNRWVERMPEPRASEDPEFPQLLLFGMGIVLVVDHERGVTWRLSVVDPHRPERKAIQAAYDRLEQLDAPLDLTAPRPTFSGERIEASARPTIRQMAFETIVRRAQDFIAAGDIYQANLSHRFTGPWHGSPWALYRALRRVNPSPFACLVHSPEASIVSCSPERLVRIDGFEVSSRPIAGTRPRGQSPDEDLMHSLELILSDKERAEHIMLVDLVRNDLGRVCRAGSVQVDELMTIEDYSHVMHLVSNVKGVLGRGMDAIDVFRAVFPGGTITGCPKVRAMEVIQALEPVDRGFYTGSCGYLGFNGSIDLNILIRTLTVRNGALSFHAGAGIVADSRPDREYQETLAKAGALLEAIHSVAPATSAAR